MKCSICGRPDTECRVRKAKGKYLCPKHYTRFYRYGVFNMETMFDRNEYVIHDGYAEIILKNKDLIETGRA